VKRRTFLGGLLAAACGPDQWEAYRPFATPIGPNPTEESEDVPSLSIGITPGSAAMGGGEIYVPPLAPVLAKCGALWWADDIAQANGSIVSAWAPRVNNISADPWVGTNDPTYETGGWVTPGGNVPSVRIASASSQYLRNNSLAVLQDGDDESIEFIIWFQSLSHNAANALLFWSSTTSTGPRKGLLHTGSTQMRWYTGGSNDQMGFSSTLNQHMMRHRVDGADLYQWREEHAGTDRSRDGAAQAVDTCCIGTQDNGGTPTNFADLRVRGLWIKDPAAEFLTDDEALEIYNWGQGSFDVAPNYSDEAWHELAFYGQSNAQGRATGAVAGLPDAGVRSWMRSLNNGELDPSDLTALSLRDDEGTDRHGAWAYAQSAEAPTPHHILLVGKGATYIGGDWAQVPGTGNTGIYTEDLYSEVYRVAREFHARMGGTRTPHIVWMQGENDAALGTTQGDYETHLTTMLARFREIHGADCPVHVVNLCEDMTGGIVLGDLQAINAAMAAVVSGDANAYLVDMSAVDGSTYLQVDALHYNAAGQSLVWDKIQTSIAAES